MTACSHPLELQSFLVGRPHLQWKQAFAAWPQGLDVGSDDIWKQQHLAGRLTVPCFDPKWSSALAGWRLSAGCAEHDTWPNKILKTENLLFVFIYLYVFVFVLL